MDKLEDIIDIVKVCSEEFGIHLNVKKTKIMIYGGNEVGSLMKIKRRLAMARTSTIPLTYTWKDMGISKATRICIMHTLAFPIALYGCEILSVGMADKNGI